MDILTVDSRNFAARDILECGQVFRFLKIDDKTYQVIAGDNIARITEDNGEIKILSNNSKFFREYFDLSTDYGKIINKLVLVNPLMQKAVKFGSGIRILKQDPYETLISFIISQNNHIPRIKGIIERLCENLGEKYEFLDKVYYGFPSPEKMAKMPIDFYKKIGAGYRAEYLEKTSRAVAEGFDLDKIFDIKSDDARKYLCTLHGVGPKVADCILLFSYYRQDVFPVDTWMKKVYFDYFDKSFFDTQKISKYFIEIFKELSGYAQQYLFYYKRSLKKEN